MRALFVSLIALAALPAFAQTGAPSKEALALGGRVARAAQPQLEKGLKAIVDNLATSYRIDQAKSGITVDEPSLEEVSQTEFNAALPLLWEGMAGAYAVTYSYSELQALDVYYRLHPGDSSKLPPALAAKSLELQQHQQALVARLGPRIMQDFFGDFCSRTACSDAIRRSAGLPVRGN